MKPKKFSVIASQFDGIIISLKESEKERTGSKRERELGKWKLFWRADYFTLF